MEEIQTELENQVEEPRLYEEMQTTVQQIEPAAHCAIEEDALFGRSHLPRKNPHIC